MGDRTGLRPDEAELEDDEPQLNPAVKATLIPAVAMLLLFGLPAQVTKGPFRGVDVPTVQEQSVQKKEIKRAARLACTKNPDGLPKGAPCRITIESIGVDAPVIELGLRSDGTLEVPTVYSEAGWWKGGGKPGRIGSTVIVGHIDNRRGPAVFYKLPKLKAGDIVTISRVKKRPVRYVIEDLGVWAKSNFPSEIIYGPTPIAELKLITCGGIFNRSTGHYTDNIIAFGRMIGPDEF
jgi:sortase (surface protein transpeptidase)